MPANSYPTTKQDIDDGYIDWARIETRTKSNGTMKYVPVVCGTCGKERIVQAPSVLSGVNRGKTTARCRTCAPLKKREALLEQYRQRGDEALTNGVTIHWATIQGPPPGRSEDRYTVEVSCKCGRRWRRVVPSLDWHSCLCRGCASSKAHSGPKNPRWKDGFINPGGYKVIRIPPDHPMIAMSDVRGKAGWGMILEHRMVAAMAIGRVLESWEHVHHLNGNKTDNRTENLQIISPDKHHTINAMKHEINKLRKENAKLRKRLAERTDG